MPLLTGRPEVPEKIMEYEKRLNECLDLLENIWLKNKSYLVGTEISIADLLGTCEVEQVRK